LVQVLSLSEPTYNAVCNFKIGAGKGNKNDDKELGGELLEYVSASATLRNMVWCNIRFSSWQ
jgi:hypothetical protein